MNQEQEIIYQRTILLDENKSDLERRVAQKRLMELLNLKEEDTNGEYPGNDQKKGEFK